jgi:alpha-L-fucosidase
MPENRQPQAADTSWFVHDRFGLFIHWGLFSVHAKRVWHKSWEKVSEEHYQKYFDRFDPDLYDPQSWATTRPPGATC